MMHFMTKATPTIIIDLLSVELLRKLQTHTHSNVTYKSNLKKPVMRWPLATPACIF